MRCASCNCNLTDEESTRKSRITNEYLDLCDSCFSDIQDEFLDLEEQADQADYERIYFK